MNPYVNSTDPNLYGQYYMGQTSHTGPHNNYATYYNQPYVTTHNNNTVSNVVTTVTGQYTAQATSIPGYQTQPGSYPGNQNRNLFSNVSTHNPQRALKFHPAPSLSNVKQSKHKLLSKSGSKITPIHYICVQ